MKIFLAVVFLAAAVAAQQGYSGLDEQIFEVENIQPFARTARQGYGSAGGGVKPIAQKPYAPSYGGGVGPGQGGGSVSFGGSSGGGGYNQGLGFNSPAGSGWSGPGPAPYRNPHQVGGGGNFGQPQKPIGGGGYGTGPVAQVKPIQSGYGSGGPGYGSGGQGFGGGAQISKPISGGGFGGPGPVKPQPGGYGSDSYGSGFPSNSGFGGAVGKPQTGPGFGSPGPVGDSYSSPPIVEQGFGVPEKVPSSSGPVGYGR